MNRAYKPHYAKASPQKISVALPDGQTVVRSVRWDCFLPDWANDCDAHAKIPYVVINNDPYIICTHNGEPENIITLATYLKSYGIEIWSTGGKKSKEWWRYMQ